ncbi:MAG: hypothetical protein PHP62_04105, partial [Candidatus Moranbacteria bacterium]|nr:hypothetical protein [Candidatus Moranbacteria bacterium]
VKKENSIVVKALCMNDRRPQPVVTYVPPSPATPVVKPEPAPKAVVCDPSEFFAQLEYYKQEMIWCKFYSLNNASLHFGKGTAKQELYYCEGGRNKQLLPDAIYEFEVVERNFNNGHELAKGQKFGDKPKGIRTATVLEAKVVLQKARWNHSLAIRELYGSQAQYEFARQHKSAFIGKDHKLHVPTCAADLKH